MNILWLVLDCWDGLTEECYCFVFSLGIQMQPEWEHCLQISIFRLVCLRRYLQGPHHMAKPSRYICILDCLGMLVRTWFKFSPRHYFIVLLIKFQIQRFVCCSSAHFLPDYFLAFDFHSMKLFEWKCSISFHARYLYMFVSVSDSLKDIIRIWLWRFSSAAEGFACVEIDFWNARFLPVYRSGI